MLRRNRLLVFLLQFAVAYGLLLAPWPGWNSLYSGLFRRFAATFFAQEQGQVIVRFRPAEHPVRSEIDSEIVVVDRAGADATGHAPAKVLGLDTRGVGWVPTALMLALAVATPLPWQRRWLVLVAGVLLVHGYLLGVVASFLWNRSAGLVPVSFIPYWPPLGGFLEETFVTQMGPSFAVPVLLWFAAILATERAAHVRPTPRR